jgi:hypothetical protein
LHEIAQDIEDFVVLLGRIELPTSSLPKQGKHGRKVRITNDFADILLALVD